MFMSVNGLYSDLCLMPPIWYTSKSSAKTLLIIFADLFAPECTRLKSLLLILSTFKLKTFNNAQSYYFIYYYFCFCTVTVQKVQCKLRTTPVAYLHLKLFWAANFNLDFWLKRYYVNLVIYTWYSLFNSCIISNYYSYIDIYIMYPFRRDLDIACSYFIPLLIVNVPKESKDCHPPPWGCPDLPAQVDY